MLGHACHLDATGCQRYQRAPLATSPNALVVVRQHLLDYQREYAINGIIQLASKRVDATALRSLRRCQPGTHHTGHTVTDMGPQPDEGGQLPGPLPVRQPCARSQACATSRAALRRLSPFYYIHTDESHGVGTCHTPGIGLTSFKEIPCLTSYLSRH